MNHLFWHERWASDRIGFHKSTVNSALTKHWHALAFPKKSRILVPLCGKSLDLLWLHRQGYRVLGVDLSQKAILAFFAENDLMFTLQDSGEHTQYIGTGIAEGIVLICGDIMTLSIEIAGVCDGLYDRAAMIALPPTMRTTYGSAVRKLLSRNARGLLLTICYPEGEREGPPFSVRVPAYGKDAQFECVETTDLLADPISAQRYSVSEMSEKTYAVNFSKEME
jgi:thiopurine S-methyltransferase